MHMPYYLKFIPIGLILLTGPPTIQSAFAQTAILPMELRVIDQGGPRPVQYDVRIRLHPEASGDETVAADVLITSSEPEAGLIRLRPEFEVADLANARYASLAIRRAGQDPFVELLPRVPTGVPPGALLANQAQTALSAATGSVDADHIVAGSLDWTKVETADIQVPLTGTCGQAAGIRAIGVNGAVTCQQSVPGETGPSGPPGPATEVYLLCSRTGSGECNCPSNRLVTRLRTGGSSKHLMVNSVNTSPLTRWVKPAA